MKPFKHLFTPALIAMSVASFAQMTNTITTDSTAKSTKTIECVVSDFTVYVGLNNFTGSLLLNGDARTFRPIGSRFVAMAWQKRIPLFVNGPTKLRLITGPEVAWNNFMIEQSGVPGRDKLTEQNNRLSLETASVDVRKSKFVTTQLNLPVVLNVAFKSGLTVGVGAYAGIRLDSYTAVKPEGGRAVRDHGSFNLNPVRWGLITELGFRGSAKLFGRYEPNSPFRAGQAPDAGVWAVGLKL